MANEKELSIDEVEEPKGKSKLILFIIIGVLVVGVAVGVTLFLVSGGESEETADAEEAAPAEEVAVSANAPAIYIKMKPEFIVNYQVGPRQRYLQVYMEAMTRSPQAAEALEMHSPMIRSSVIRIMSEFEFEFLRTPEGRTQLQYTVTEEVRRIVEQESGVEGGVEQVLFTNFVMQ